MGPLGSVAVEGGRISKGAFLRLRWAMQLLSVSLQKGNCNAEMYRKSGLVISREQGVQYDAGMDVHCVAVPASLPRDLLFLQSLSLS